jgi:hypothetical protein
MAKKTIGIPSSSTKIDRSKLHIDTRKNLLALEKLGFDFEESAFSSPVEQGTSEDLWLAEDKVGRKIVNGGVIDRIGHSFFIKGIDPVGKPILYCRYETRHPAAGRTLLKTPHGNVQVNAFLHSSSGTYGSKKAHSYYLALLKGK